MSAISARLVVLACVALMAPPYAGAADIGTILRPLPFAGPYSGTVVDFERDSPIPGATVEVEWMRHDNPLPDGPGHHTIKASAKTDRNGVFKIEKQETRGGLSATDVTIRVTAQGYITRVFIIDPNALRSPLPQQTIDWPFQNTSVHVSPPVPLHVRLKPALPVILKALQSKDPLIKQTAEEELRRLKNTPAVSP